MAGFKDGTDVDREGEERGFFAEYDDGWRRHRLILFCFALFSHTPIRALEDAK